MLNQSITTTTKTQTKLNTPTTVVITIISAVNECRASVNNRQCISGDSFGGGGSLDQLSLKEVQCVVIIFYYVKTSYIIILHVEIILVSVCKY